MDVKDDGVDPTVDGVEFGGAGPRLLGRRHLAGAERLGDLLPRLGPFEGGLLVLDVVEPEAAARLLAAVAPGAVLVENGQHVLLEVRGRGRGERRLEGRGDSAEKEREPIHRRGPRGWD